METLLGAELLGGNVIQLFAEALHNVPQTSQPLSGLFGLLLTHHVYAYSPSQTVEQTLHCFMHIAADHFCASKSLNKQML